MPKGKIVGLFISPLKGEPMQSVTQVKAIAGAGLEGDRYCLGAGSFNKGNTGHRQVTLINSIFFPESGFEYAESRRNIITDDVELMWLIGKEFEIGIYGVVMKGVKYCDPCERPGKLADKDISFKERFQDRGGLVAEILEGGLLRVNDSLIPPPKGY